MVTFVEQIDEIKREVSPVPLMANHFPEQRASISLQTRHSLSVTFHGGVHGVLLLLSLLSLLYFKKKKNFNLSYTSLFFFSISLSLENIFRKENKRYWCMFECNAK